MRKRNGKGSNTLPSSYRVSAKLILTRSDIERGKEIGAEVEREENPTMLVYYDPSIMKEKPKREWWE